MHLTPVPSLTADATGAEDGCNDVGGYISAGGAAANIFGVSGDLQAANNNG